MNRAEILERALETVGRSQAELARRLRRSGPTVSRWFSGGNDPDYASALAIAQMAGLDPVLVLRTFGHDPTLLPVSVQSGDALPVMEIHGELTQDDQEAVEELFGLSPEERQALRVLMRRRRVPPLNPQGGKPPIRIFVRTKVHSGEHHPAVARPRERGVPVTLLAAWRQHEAVPALASDAA
jgi:transcriptional regulator with XRE-family HTH domain